MALLQIVQILLLVLIRSMICAASHDHHSPAIFTFGDSLSDVGNVNILAPGRFCSTPPHGITLGSITGRCTDGLLVIDLISKYLGMGLATPSLAFNSTSFKSLDFAYSGATVLLDSPLAQQGILFSSQISQFLAYKRSVLAKNPLHEAEFGKSIYVIEIGGNDITLRLFNTSFESIKTNVVPRIVEGLRAGIIDLYKNGSRHFFIVNMPGIGCSPFLLAGFQNVQGLRLDRFGCLKDVNEVVAAFNEGIEALVVQLRHELPHGKFVLFDFFKAKFSVLRHSHKLGFKFTTQAACCGSGGAYNCSGGGAICGCGDLVSSSCDNPSEYISWDGLHYTQSFYERIAEAILKKKYLDA